jgi:hypothetical protein
MPSSGCTRRCRARRRDRLAGCPPAAARPPRACPRPRSAVPPRSSAPSARDGRSARTEYLARTARISGCRSCRRPPRRTSGRGPRSPPGRSPRRPRRTGQRARRPGSAPVGGVGLPVDAVHVDFQQDHDAVRAVRECVVEECLIRERNTATVPVEPARADKAIRSRRVVSSLVAATGSSCRSLSITARRPDTSVTCAMAGKVPAFWDIPAVPRYRR